MTAHAAKGLEAPVVFLVDSGSRAVQRAASAAPDAVRIGARPVARHRLSLARSARMSRTTIRAPPRRGSGSAAEDEYRRLLYVGMTRAEDRLIVCGYHGKRRRTPAPGMRWSAAALVGIPEIEELPHPVTARPRPSLPRQRPQAQAMAGRRSSRAQAAAQPPRRLAACNRCRRNDAAAAADAIAAPRLLIEDAPEPAMLARSPVLDGDEEPGFADGARPGDAQSAAGPARHCRRRRARRPRGAISSGSAARLASRTSASRPSARSMRILDEPAFAPLFSEDSRAEVSVMGQVTLRSAASSAPFPARSTGWRSPPTRC